MARRPGLPRTRPSIKRWLRRQVFLRDDFTCQQCQWRPADVPDNYDGRATLKELVGSRKRKRSVGPYAVAVYEEIPVYRQLELDHIHPWSEEGPEIPENLQTLCNRCNASKGARV